MVKLVVAALIPALHVSLFNFLRYFLVIVYFTLNLFDSHHLVTIIYLIFIFIRRYTALLLDLNSFLLRKHGYLKARCLAESQVRTVISCGLI